jgi:hypothetical protein
VHSGGEQAPLFQPQINYRMLDFDKSLSMRMARKIVKRVGRLLPPRGPLPRDLRRTAITGCVTSGLHGGECGAVVMIHSYPSKAGSDHVLVWVRLDLEGNTDAFAPEGLEAQ